MGKYIKLFSTTAEYNAAKNSLDLPNVSVCEDALTTVHYNPWVETRVVAKFNVTSTSSPTQIVGVTLSKPRTMTTAFTSIEIDGVEQPSVVSAYTFSTTGEHIVKYTLTDSTSIGDYAFTTCSKLTSIDIPSGVTSIGSDAFLSCSSLTSIDIPSGVTSIGSSAFGNCSSLTSIDIPSGVTSIGFQVFYQCSSLTSVTSLRTTAPTIQSNTFHNVNTNGTLYVPQGSSGYDTWMQNANYYLGMYNWTKVEQ